MCFTLSRLFGALSPPISWRNVLYLCKVVKTLHFACGREGRFNDRLMAVSRILALLHFKLLVKRGK